MNWYLEYVEKLVRRGKLNMLHAIHFFADKNDKLLWHQSSNHPRFSYLYAECRLYVVRRETSIADVPVYFFVIAGDPEEAVENAFQSWIHGKKERRHCEMCRVAKLCTPENFVNVCAALGHRWCKYAIPFFDGYGPHVVCTISKETDPEFCPEKNDEH